MLGKPLIYALLVWITHPILITGQDIQFRHITKNEGLPFLRTCYSIHQDRNGFMWFGSDIGLHKFDGYEFRNFVNNLSEANSLRGKSVYSVYEGPNHRLWIGSSQGLELFLPASESFRHIKVRKPDGSITEMNERIIGVAENPNGNPVVYSSVNTYQLLPAEEILLPHPITALPQDVELGQIVFYGDLMIVGTSNNGLYIFGKKHKKLVHLNAASRFISDRITCLFTDNERKIWIGTDKGLVTLRKGDKPGSYQTETLLRSYIWKIAQDNSGNIWVATDGEGVFRFNNRNGEVLQLKQKENNPTSILSDKAINVFIDKQQTLWAITQNGNLNFASLHNTNTLKRYSNYPGNSHSLSNNVVNAFAEDTRGNIWIATDGGGLDCFDRQTGSFKHFRADKKPGSISSNSIISLFIDSEKILWIGTFDGGLCRFNEKTQTFTCFTADPYDSTSIGGNHIWAITEDNNRNIIAATHSSGISIFYKKTQKFTRITARGPGTNTLSNNGATSLVRDLKNNLWIGTFHGLNCYNTSTGKIDHFFAGNGDNSIAGSVINSLALSSDKKLLVGTDNGLSVYDIDTGKFKNFNSSHGLSDQNIISILDDGNQNIWLGTFTGLSRLDKKTGKVENFSFNDELQGNIYTRGAIMKDRNGDIFFGGTNGFIIVDPDRIRKDRFLSPIYITNVRVNDQSMTLEQFEKKQKHSGSINTLEELRLSNNENSYSIKFAALDYVDAFGLQYYYRLTGFDKNWRKAGARERMATYTNLDPGTYTFEVYATSDKYASSSPTARLNIIILPPWWKTWWAYLLYGAFFSGLLWMYYRYQQIRLKYKSDLYFEKLQREKEHETHQLKVGFFTQVSHEFRTPLTLISGPLQKMLANPPSDPKYKTYLQLMQRNVDRLLTLINQILEFRKIESGKTELNLTFSDMIGLFRSVCDNFNLIAEQNQISFTLQTENEYMLAGFDHDKVEKILSNLLSNAFKYTPKGGKIAASLSALKPRENKYYVEIEVTDNGVGIPAEALDKLFTPFYRVGNNQQTGTGIGLALTKELVTLHGGQITAKSTAGEETTFTVSLEVAVLDENSRTKQLSEREDAELPDSGRTFGVLPETAPLVLVVEDNADVRQFLRLELGDTFRILEAEDGSKGFEIAIETIPDLIISDVMMPEMNGTELCEKIKSDYRTSHIPVILLTALHADEKKIESYDLGADEYITKPFNPEILKARVHNLINSRFKLKDLFSGAKAQNDIKPAVNRMDNEFIQKMVVLIEENLEEASLSPEWVAEKLGLSKMQLYRKMKALSHQTVSELIKSVRMHKAEELLLAGELTVSEISFKLGFSEQSNFSRSFFNHFGKYPTQYLKEKNI